MEGGGDESEWNEQMLYASIYFGLTNQCRMAQSQQNTTWWKDVLSSKICHAMGISNDQEKEDLRKMKSTIDEAWAKYSCYPERMRQKGGGSRILYDLNNNLFEVEARVDSIVNKHMPFLKRKKAFNIQEL